MVFIICYMQLRANLHSEHVYSMCASYKGSFAKQLPPQLFRSGWVRLSKIPPLGKNLSLLNFPFLGSLLQKRRACFIGAEQWR